MKKYLLLTALTLTLPLVSAQAGIIKSAHDFSLTVNLSSTPNQFGVTGTTAKVATTVWSTSAGVCSVCHSAHNNDLTGLAPLWQHYTDPAASYTLYSSPTLVGSPLLAATSVSRACLSCHDGQTALNASFKKNPALSGTSFVAAGYVGGSKAFGTDLHNVHPIGIAYTGNGAAQGLNDPTLTIDATWTAIAPGTIGNGLAPGLGALTITKALLRNGNVECVSCHDPHFNLGATGQVPTGATRVSSTKISGLDVNLRGSTLCRTCHNK